MQIRGMQRADEPFVRGAGETLAASLYPEFIPDAGKEIELLRRADYAKVIGEVGRPHSALIAISSNNVWATKRHTTIALWYGEKTGGLRLLWDFKRWVREQNILVGALIDDYGMLIGTRVLLRSAGFEQRGGAFMYFPKGSKR
jgi:hypothetical protein